MAYLSGLPSFALYYSVSILLLALFTWFYVKFTPYNEIRLINEGNTAAACALGGAMLGFAMPVGVACFRSANMVDFVVWALIAAVSQILTFVIVEKLFANITQHITDNTAASGIFLGSTSVVIGLLNAATMAG